MQPAAERWTHLRRRQGSEWQILCELCGQEILPPTSDLQPFYVYSTCDACAETLRIMEAVAR